MRELRKWVWTAVVAVVAAAPVAAQQGTVTTGGGQTTSNLTGTGGLTGGGAGTLGGNSTGGTGGTGSSTGGTGGSDFSGTALQTMQAPPKLTAPTGTATSSLQKSNFLAGYYANPYYQGQITSQTAAVPGGFGSPLYGTTGTTGRGAIGGTGTTGTGTAGGAGRTGIGGQSSTNQSGILIPLPVQINYTAQMQFATPPVAAGKILTEIRSTIDNTSMIANPKTVQVITDASNNVTLRGNVKDDDESRLIEGLVRLTPGVGSIKNELAFPVASR
jgi:hypothetical protein